MTRILLRFFNFPGLVLLTLLGIAVQTSLFSFWPLSYLQPDIVMLVVVWMALKRGFAEGGTLTLVISDFAELHSAAPQGIFMISYMTVFLCVRGLARIIVIPNISSLIMVTLFVSLAWKLEILAIMHLLGAGGNQWRHTLLFLFPGAVVEGLLAIAVYRGLELYDAVTCKSVRSEQGSLMTDDELAIEGEGVV
jgi:hypothetical protein